MGEEEEESIFEWGREKIRCLIEREREKSLCSNLSGRGTRRIAHVWVRVGETPWEEFQMMFEWERERSLCSNLSGEGLGDESMFEWGKEKSLRWGLSEGSDDVWVREGEERLSEWGRVECVWWGFNEGGESMLERGGEQGDSEKSLCLSGRERDREKSLRWCCVLQCVAACCSVLQCELQCVAVCCSVLLEGGFRWC